MAIRVQNLPKKNFNHASVLSTPHFGVTYPPWWNLNEQQIPPSVPKSSTSKEESPTQLHLQGKHLGLQFGEPESSSTQSAGNSSHEVSVMGGANSQDQSISSESGQDESCARSVEGQTKPVFLFNNPEIIFNTAQADQGHPMVCVPYATVDPYFGGLLTPYGPQAIVQPQMGSQIVGMGPARVPLPLNLAEDGPIYVNAKQYHGILRRRQSRAKMEAQNKLVKTRKPYLHESRHIHALNRVRGSGGRFLSTKRLQQVDPALSNPNPCAAGARDPSKSTSELETHHTAASEKHFTSTVTTSSITSLSSHDAFCSDGRFSGLTMQMGGGVQCNGGLLHSSATQHCSSSVR